ncbi:MAG: FAD:protein FMN transferase [Bryobacteraceae bacterium]|nr:FAD:protein FMN transferase [Bryobacteraceae bacterium]
MSSTSRRLLILLAAFPAILPGADRYRASEPHMGTVVTITLYAESGEQAQEAFAAAFRRVEELNNLLSDYKPDSELSRVCDTEGNLSPELLTVLTAAQKLAAETGGAFDVTVGPLTRLWRSLRNQGRLPNASETADALSRSGYQKLELIGRRAYCRAPGMQLDAGGIAKGYAADEALAVLRKLGIRSALVAVSGDLAIGEAPPGKQGWQVQVFDRILTLSNLGVSTSGDEFQFLEIDGVRYSHIVDPRTGMPLPNSKPVSVIAKTAMEADALATALSVLGPQGAKPLQTRHDIQVFFK